MLGSTPWARAQRERCVLVSGTAGAVESQPASWPHLDSPSSPSWGAAHACVWTGVLGTRSGRCAGLDDVPSPPRMSTP